MLVSQLIQEEFPVQGPRPFAALPQEEGGLTSSATDVSVTIDIDVGAPRQQIVGYGAALTESSAVLIHHSPRREKLLDDFFLPAAQGGCGISLLRVPVGASDFSVSPPEEGWTNVSAEGSDFDFSREKSIVVPVLRAAMARNPALRVILSPWSAPAWMKTNGRLAGGSLHHKYLHAYAKLLMLSVLAFEEEGVRVFGITVQNEPYHAAAYPSMTMSVDEQAAFVKVLVPMLRCNGLATRVLVHDHNYDRADDVVQLLESVGHLVDGTAWHLYAGTDTQVLTRGPIADAGVFITEQTAHTARPRDGTPGDLFWMMNNVLLGPTLAGARCGIEWNLALDAEFGPHLPQGPSNCRGIIEVPRMLNAEHERSPEFYGLAHMNNAAPADAWRVEATPSRAHGVTVAAFISSVREDGVECGVVLMNEGGSPATVTIRVAGPEATHREKRTYTVPSRAVASLSGWRIPHVITLPVANDTPRVSVDPFVFPESFTIATFHGRALAAHGEHRDCVYQSENLSGHWETWTAEEVSRRSFVLRSFRGTFLGVDGDRVVQVSPSLALRFSVIQFPDGKVAFLSSRGCLQALSSPDFDLRLAQCFARGWEAFNIVPA